MVLLKRPPLHDAVVVLARIAARTWLRLSSAAARFGGVAGTGRVGVKAGVRVGAKVGAASPIYPIADDPAVRVSTLERMAERGIWRCETIAALHAAAGDVLALADQDYAQVLVQLARTRATQPPAGAQRPAGDGDAPLAA